MSSLSTAVPRECADEPAPTLSIQVLTGSQILLLRDEWLHLREQRGVTIPNSDPDRFAIVASTLGNHVVPCLLVFRRGATLVGLVAARLSKRRQGYRIGYLTFGGRQLQCFDVVYGGVLLNDDTELFRFVCSHLASMLESRQAECVCFNHLANSHPLNNMFDRRIMRQEPTDLHWKLDLDPQPQIGVPKQFSKKHRYNMRRLDKLLIEHFSGNVQLRVFKAEEDLDLFCEGSAAITAQTYQAGIGAGFRDDAVWKALLRCEAQRGRLRCYWLVAGGRPIAHQVGCVYGKTYYLEATSFLPEYRSLSPGQVLHVRVLQDLPAIGVRNVDYGFGDAEYKRVFGSRRCGEASISLYGPGLNARISLFLGDLLTVLGRISRHVLLGLGLLAGVKKHWRARRTKTS